MFRRQVPTYRPKSEGEFPNSIIPKFKSMLSGVMGGWGVRSLTHDAGQVVDFYTYERKSIVHGLLMAVNSSDGQLLLFMRASTDLHGLAPRGTVLSFPERFVLYDAVLYDLGRYRNIRSSHSSLICHIDTVHHINPMALQ